MGKAARESSGETPEAEQRHQAAVGLARGEGRGGVGEAARPEPAEGRLDILDLAVAEVPQKPSRNARPKVTEPRKLMATYAKPSSSHACADGLYLSTTARFGPPWK